MLGGNVCSGSPVAGHSLGRRLGATRVGSQRPRELLPEDALLSAKAVSLVGWAVNAFGAGVEIPLSEGAGRTADRRAVGPPHAGCVDAVK